MSKGTAYLEYVKEQLHTSIEELNKKIDDVDKDISGMHEYYWENYTEMDQYGYENYDNQQALLLQVNTNQENRKRRMILRKMEDSPFFGSVEFQYEGEEEGETFYIGIQNFSLGGGKIPLIYDWRAPVSSLFYDYDKGEASYLAPGGLQEGEILSKWQYKIRYGKMVYEFESDIKIDDDILKQELGANGDVKLKNIIRTIQKEQNQIIRNRADKFLIIQGAAGSGKTSVALHRIAYLLYHERERLNSSNILVLSPNGVFSDYISHILPELGEENIQEMSLDVYAYRELQGIVQDCEDRFHEIERGIAGISKEEEARFRFKQSQQMLQEMEGFLIELEDRLVDFHKITYKTMEISEEEIRQFFYYKFMDQPILSRIDSIRDYYLDQWETLRGKDLPEEERELWKEKFDRLYITKDLYKIYNWFLESLGYPTLPDVSPEQRILPYEDVYPMLYLKSRLLKKVKGKKIRHLVIDEMQDYSYLQYVLLKELFSCNMTILGDKQQTVDSQVQDVLEFLPQIFKKGRKTVVMNKSYRNTWEISRYAQEISGDDTIQYVDRHGKEVGNAQCENLKEVIDYVEKELRLSKDAFETAAILTMTDKEAAALYEQYKGVRSDVQLLHRDSTAFKKGLTITTFYLAKGLEFDQVYLLGGEKTNPYYKQFQYIGATRALHELYILTLK